MPPGLRYMKPLLSEGDRIRFRFQTPPQSGSKPRGR